MTGLRWLLHVVCSGAEWHASGSDYPVHNEQLDGQPSCQHLPRDSGHKRDDILSTSSCAFAVQVCMPLAEKV